MFARFAVIAFFAIAFLQSALDKILDPDGNLEFLSGHFANAPFPPEAVRPLFWTLTVMEATAGVLCALAIPTFSFANGGWFARWGLGMAVLSLLALFFGQRMAKDYAGASVIAAYFAVALLGLVVFAIGR
ncbi:MAG: DoxX family protein [Alphaproteobacteria bacterium]